MALPSLLIVEDHNLLRMGMRVALDKLSCCTIVGEADNGEKAVAEALRLKPDVILMDVGLPGIDGIEATWRIKKKLPHTKIVMFTAHSEPEDITAALGAGAEGYCIKETPVESVAAAIAAVTRGEFWIDPSIAEVVMRNGNDSGNSQGVSLSDSEMEILALVRKGLDNDAIAVNIDRSTEKLARIMGDIISRFIEKAALNHRSEETHTRISRTSNWLTEEQLSTVKEKVFEGKYAVGELLGSGGIGAVFKARHIYMDRMVALKVIRSELAEDRYAMRNFQREATAVANLHHKNIVEIYDFGISENDEPYMVMEFVPGSTLADLVQKKQPLPLDRALVLGADISLALAEAHSRGIIHCDIKPSNILINRSEQNEIVKVVDFGLAQIIPKDCQQQSLNTDKFFVCGTPFYMSPEQCSGSRMDLRSDIYSLGCVMFELLTGQKVFTGKTPSDTFAKHCYELAPTLPEVYPDGHFSAALDHTIACMLAKDPADRPQSMAEVRQALLKSTLQR